MKKKARKQSTARKKSLKPIKSEDQPPELEEMQELVKLIKDAPEIRKILVSKIEENPTDELKQMLADFDESLEIGKRRFSKMAAAEFKRQFKIIDEELTGTIENADDEEFLRLGEDSEAARHVRDYVKQRPATVKALGNLHPDDRREILAVFNKVISDAQNRLKEKRDRAEKRFPHLKKIYEMPDHYQQAMADLLEAINVRDDIVKALKIVPPNQRAEGIRLAAQMTEKIEEAEQSLANEYETHQTYARAMDDMRQLLKSYSPEELAEIREHFRKNPGTMEAMEKMLAEEFPE